MTLLEKILQKKIDKINRSMYDDTDFCSRYHVHRIRKYDDNKYITLEFSDKETSYIKQETHTAKEWLSNELIIYFIAKAIRESNNSLYSNEQLQRRYILGEDNVYRKVTRIPVPKKQESKEKAKKTKSKSLEYHIKQHEIITDISTLSDLPLNKGAIYYTIDTDEVFCDTETQRVKLYAF